MILINRKFHHFVITRFDLRAAKWRTDKNNQPTLSDAWYAQRFQLFEQYCFHSMELQTNQQFDWLIIMDERTKAAHRQRLSDIIGKYGNMHLLLNFGFDRYLEKILEKIRSICLTKFGQIPKYMLTSRLDNDDCLHPSFIEEIQKQTTALEEKTLIDAMTGFYIDPMTLNMVRMSVPNNPFLSIYEDTDQMGSVLARMHHEWHDFFPRIELSRPLWATVVHQSNLRNRLPNVWRTNPGEAADFADFFPIRQLTNAQKITMRLSRYLGNFGVGLKHIYYPTKRALINMLPHR